MIRLAEYRDIPAIIAIVDKFFAHGELDGLGLSVDHDTVEFLAVDTIDSDTMLALVAEVDGEIVGVIGGGVQPWMLNANILTVVELWWFVPQEYRERNPMAAFGLLRGLLKWGKAKGATVKIIASTKREETPRVVKFYESIGLRHTDSYFCGKL